MPSSDSMSQILGTLDHLVELGIPSNWQQEPYKSKIFDVFKATYGDGVEGDNVYKWWTKNKESDNQTLEFIDDVRRSWIEWKYALDNQ